MLLDKEYCVPTEVQDVLSEQRRQVREDAETFKEQALLMQSFFPDLAAKKSHARLAARIAVEEFIVEPGSLMTFYANLRAPKGQRKLPPSRLLSDTWALYRWLQIDFLFCVDLYFRFGSRLSEPLSPKEEQGIQHDILDAQYLLVGVLEGNFATHETKLIRWFKAILPKGNLYAKDA